jgi:hypothetical protein
MAQPDDRIQHLLQRIAARDDGRDAERALAFLGEQAVRPIFEAIASCPADWDIGIGSRHLRRCSSISGARRYRRCLRFSFAAALGVNTGSTDGSMLTSVCPKRRSAGTTSRPPLAARGDAVSWVKVAASSSAAGADKTMSRRWLSGVISSIVILSPIRRMWMIASRSSRIAKSGEPVSHMLSPIVGGYRTGVLETA